MSLDQSQTLLHDKYRYSEDIDVNRVINIRRDNEFIHVGSVVKCKYFIITENGTGPKRPQT